MRCAVWPESSWRIASQIARSVAGPDHIINVDPDPEHISLGMKVKLATYSLGTDDKGVEAIGFGFEPINS